MSLYSVNMPDLGEGVLEGEIQKWLVHVGDTVQEDQTLLEVMTDKASVEIPSPVAGQVKELKVQEGESCPIGKPLAVLETSEAISKKSSVKKESPFQRPSIKPSDSKKEISKNDSVQKTSSEASFKEDLIQAVPAVRKKAKELEIDLKSIQGTGLAGRITMRDLEKIKPSSSSVKNISISIPENKDQKRIPLKGIRKKIAEKMQLSTAVIPHFTLMDQASVEALYKLKNQSKKLYPDIKITYLSFITKILQNCLNEFPEFNASIDSKTEEIVYKKYLNFGIATDTPRGLLVPVIKNVNRKNIIQICKEIVELSEKARNSKIKPEEMQDSTITITNMGSIAGRWATPIINPPEVCILGMYRVFKNPVWKEDRFQPVRTMNFSLTCDHRLIDGALAARFISRFIESVENPSLILIEG